MSAAPQADASVAARCASTRPDRRRLLPLALLCAGLAGHAPAVAQTPIEDVRVTADAAVTPLPHFWETMFGSGRAILSLRDAYRQDLRAVKAVTGLEYVRFHNILHDEVGLVTLESGELRYNFSYVDQIYDGLLENGVRPFVEIGFMPTALTSNPAALHEFAYHPNVAPPQDYAQWDALITHFVGHLVERYGIDEVAAWYFEVWNEPNLDFWRGEPKQGSYFELYSHTARDIKAVSPRLRVGGPATAQAAWVEEFLRQVHATGTPVDFVSSHVYANDPVERVFGERAAVPRNEMVCRAVRRLHDQIGGSALPHLPLIVSEYNASYKTEPAVTDSVFMGPWLADTIRQCAGFVDLMSYWTFSDVFEEQGVVKSPFYGGYGLMAERGIAKPAFNAFVLLHKLGEERIAIDSTSALATRTRTGDLVIALWNYVGPAQGGTTNSARTTNSGGTTNSARNELAPVKSFRLSLPGIAAHAALHIWRLDAGHGNVVAAFDAMGRPATPTPRQIGSLRAAALLPRPEQQTYRPNSTIIEVPPRGLVLVEVLR